MRAWPATPTEVPGPLACLRAGGVGFVGVPADRGWLDPGYYRKADGYWCIVPSPPEEAP